MLRITRSDEAGSVSNVKLEGKLLRPWVDEVRGLFLATNSATLPRLELAGLTFADAAGTELLQELLRRGVQVESCSGYVGELLQQIRHRMTEGLPRAN